MTHLDPDASFRTLESAEQARLLVRLGWELTLVARDYYAPGTLELTDVAAVRLVNEIQHRVTAHALSCLAGADGDAPVGYGFVADCWEHNGLSDRVRRAYIRAYESVRPPVAAVG